MPTVSPCGSVTSHEICRNCSGVFLGPAGLTTDPSRSANHHVHEGTYRSSGATNDTLCVIASRWCSPLVQKSCERRLASVQHAEALRQRAKLRVRGPPLTHQH